MSRTRSSGTPLPRDPIGELTARHTEAFLAEFARLRVATPDVLPRATDHIPDMAALIGTLLERGHAYRTEDGSIFFRIASWPAYGILARIDPSQQRVGERVEADEYSKDDVRDFALWKGARAASRAGRPPSARADPAGTSSAPR